MAKNIDPKLQNLPNLFTYETSLPEAELLPDSAIVALLKRGKILLFTDDNQLTLEDIKKFLAELGQTFLAQEELLNEESLVSPWRALQIQFYKNYENYHYLWPQEELIADEATIIAQYNLSQEDKNSFLKNLEDPQLLLF